MGEYKMQNITIIYIKNTYKKVHKYYVNQHDMYYLYI